MDGRRPLRRSDVYKRAVVDGRELRDNPLARLKRQFSAARTSAREREEAALEGELRSHPGVSRANTIAVISPKGGVGKTTCAFLLGNLLCSHLGMRVVAVDANPDFGNLASLAPSTRRVERSLADLLDDLGGLRTAAELRPYVSQLPTGLHVVGAPERVEAMAAMTAARYGDALAFLGQFYEAVLLDLGPGITDPIARLSIQRADQLLVVATADQVTADQVLGSLRHIDHDRTTLVLNQARERGGGHRSVAVPRDERLRTMLDTGTYSLEALRPDTRMAVKQLGLAVAEQIS
ncbi:MAG TPA: AAA family ATPase [Thermoleophilaceae bacterium]|nr:AAA family ATPase [Thermoleophilaceae bacterium]